MLVEERLVDEFLPQTAPQTAVYVALNGTLRKIAGFDFHRGVLACGKVPRFPNVEELAQEWNARANLVVCPNVQDPENLGTILRTCTALGVNAAVLGRDSAFAFSRWVIRVSMAAVLELPILDTPSLAEDLRRPKND